MRKDDFDVKGGETHFFEKTTNHVLSFSPLDRTCAQMMKQSSAWAAAPAVVTRKIGIFSWNKSVNSFGGLTLESPPATRFAPLAVMLSSGRFPGFACIKKVQNETWGVTLSNA